MKLLVLILQVVVSLTLVGLILLQNTRGGLGASFGGADFYRTKRGAEKLVFTATIVFTVLFLLTSIANLLIR